MRAELLEKAAELARRGEPFALATVVARKAPISAEVGDAALIGRDGSFHGWVGGSCTRPVVAEQALLALTDGRPRRVVLDPEARAPEGEGVFVFPMTCHSGGRVEIHIQPVLPAPQLLVFGVSPAARALARLAHAMGYRVTGVDPRADATAFPGMAVASEPGAVAREKGGAPLFAVVATQGEWDEAAVLAALAHEPDYLAVVASKKRFAEMRGVLLAKASSASVERIRNPAGLDLGARLPEEVAVSILAQIIQERRAAAAAQPSAKAEQAEAVDPVCGMTVKVPEMAPRAEHKGRAYFFCCGGCKERFVASPEKYLAAGGGA